MLCLMGIGGLDATSPYDMSPLGTRARIYLISLVSLEGAADRLQREQLNPPYIASAAHAGLPQELVYFMQGYGGHEERCFVGVNIRADATRLRKDFNVNMPLPHLVDIMHTTREALGPFDSSSVRKQWSLSRLAAQFLNVELDKGDASLLHSTNWDQYTFTDKDVGHGTRTHTPTIFGM